MLRRLLALVVLAWAVGFVWFAIALPRAAGEDRTEAVVALTGGEGRIDRGLEALRKGWARQLLVSGVYRQVTAEEFAAEYAVSDQLMGCCVTLGYQAYDTSSNAREVSRWLAERGFRSVRLITSDWHMRRAAYELNRAKPDGVMVLRDAVGSQPSFRTLFLEYHKLLARRAAVLWSG